MPTSLEAGKAEALSFIKGRWTGKHRILDVGPGAGVYGRRLPDLPVDALEIHEPYVEAFGLHSIYDRVIVADALVHIPRMIEGPSKGNLLWTGKWNFPYEIVILGDVLEHWAVDVAQRFLEAVTPWATCVVSVPWNYKQGPVHGNVHEAHVQDDLTPDIMAHRYPMLRSIFAQDGIGVYVSEWPERILHDD
jgi:hypothetical protein